MPQATTSKRIVTEMPKNSQTAQCLLIGSDLRALREPTGLTQAEVAKQVRTGHATVCKGERGRRHLPEEVLRRMLALYGVSTKEIEVWVARAREARTPGRHAVHCDDAPRWFHRYLGLEQAALRKLSYETELVPGLLQTREYTQAIAVAFQAAGPSGNGEHLTEVRAARQRRLLDPRRPLVFSAVLNEAVIRRPVGGRGVMRAQLRHLATLAAEPTITLQVLPFTAPEHPAMTGGSFTMLQFAETSLTTVFVELPTGGSYIDRPEDLRRYETAFAHLTRLALGEEETRKMLRKAEQEMAHDTSGDLA